MRRCRSIICTILAVLMVVGVLPVSRISSVEAAADATVSVTVTAMYGYAYEVLDEVNKQRSANGKNPLTMDTALMEAAMQRAAESVVVGEAYSYSEISDTEAHTRPDGSKFNSWATKVGSYGENVAYGQKTPSEVMTGWMNSSGHKANILKDEYQSIGIGVVYCNGSYRYYWAQEFSTYTASQPAKRSDNVTRTFKVGVTSSIYNRLVSKGKLSGSPISGSGSSASSGSSGTSTTAKSISGTWKQTNGRWWFQYGNSWLANCWLKSGGTWYAFGADGYMYTDWHKIDGTWYYFDSSGAMAASEWRGGYWLSSSGAWTYSYKGSWHLDSKGWWFGDTSGWYACNQWQKINGKWYYFDSSGYMVTNRSIQGYYLGSDGAMR